jgi:hypothetical protein
LQDADARDLPIWMLDEDGGLHCADDLFFGTPNEDNWRAYMSVETEGALRATLPADSADQILAPLALTSEDEAS